MTSAGCHHCLKVVQVGNSRVGKNNLMIRFAGNEFDPNSGFKWGGGFTNQSVQVKDEILKVQVWHWRGIHSREYPNARIKGYYQGAVGAVLVYDITQPDTFANCEFWLHQIRDYADPNIVIMLIGNKSDLKHLRAIPTEEARHFANKYGLLFFETSALDATNVETAFRTFAAELARHIDRDKLAEATRTKGLLNKMLGPE